MSVLRRFLAWLDFDRSDVTILLGLCLVGGGVGWWSPAGAAALVGALLLALEWPREDPSAVPDVKPKPRRAA